MIRSRSIGMAGAVCAAIVLALAGTASARQNAAGRGVTAAGASRARLSADAIEPVWLARGPAVAADRRGHQIYVFWASPAGVLEEAWSADGVNDWENATLSQMGTLYSQPSVVTTFQDQSGGHSWIYVFWEGTGEHALWMAYYGTNGWNGPFQVNDGPMNSDPSASLTISATADPVVVTWTGTDGDIWYTQSSDPSARNPDGTWKNTFTTPKKAVNNGTGKAEGPIAGNESPAAAGTCTSDPSGCKDEPVFWYDKYTGYLDQGTYDVASDDWINGPGTVLTSQVLGSDPSATIASYASNEPIIAWRGSEGGGKLWVWDTASGGGPIAHPECGALGSAPAVVFSPTWTPTYPYGPVFFFWKGSTVNTLFEGYEVSNNPYTNFNCPVNGISSAPIGGDPATSG